ncbi:hypothetical protein [Rhizobium sp. ZW T2_16]|uniref:hypothetical protein n=1 Tax=Rhizobium sp. ZW T2_16 TaxID=3378083 RepID=UPI000FB2834C
METIVSPAVYQLSRGKLERWIDEAIALLDLLDGDSDLEDGADAEPSIGSAPRIFENDAEYELELDSCDDEWSGDEHEPTLGWNNPRCGEPDREEGWLPADVSDEKTYISEPDLVSSDGAEVARQMLRQVIKDHRRLARALYASRQPVASGRSV